MEKIVKEPLKIDFHIHSVASNHKKKKIVRDGTVENLSVLISKFSIFLSKIGFSILLSLL